MVKFCRIKKIIIVMLSLVLILTFCFSSFADETVKISDEKNISSEFGTYDGYNGVLLKNAKKFETGIENKYSCKSFCLIEKETGRIIASKDENQQLPVASTTKIMTAYLTSKSTYLDEFFTVDDNAVIVEGTSMGLMPGYSVTLRGLLIGMLLKSGNDGANAAAVKVGGTNENFINMMNNMAVKIGMSNTKFATPSGLDFGEPYSCAYDMALLARAALNQPEFSDICSQTTLSTMVGNPPVNVKYTGHNKILTDYEGGIGVKTGYTKKAGRCLVSAAERDGVTLICVSLCASDDISFHSKLFDFGFEKLKQSDLPNIEIPQNIAIENGVADQITLKYSKQTVPLLYEEKDRISAEYYVNNATAPCYENQVAGEIIYKLDGEEILRTPIVYSENVCKKPQQQSKKGFFGWLKGLFSKDND